MNGNFNRTLYRQRGLQACAFLEFDCGMSMLEQIEAQVKELSFTEQQALRDWLDDILGDELEFTDEFKEKIERAKSDIAEGRGRVVSCLAS